MTRRAAWELRPVRAADLEAVQVVLRGAWHETYDALIGAARVAEITGRWHSLANLRRELARATPFLLLQLESEIVGTASGRDEPDGAFAIKRIYLLRRAHGRGLGGALLEGLVARASSKATRLTLEVEPRNQRAIDFYLRYGFTVTRRTGDCNGKGAGLDSLVMTRPWTPGAPLRA